MPDRAEPPWRWSDGFVPKCLSSFHRLGSNDPLAGLSRGEDLHLVADVFDAALGPRKAHPSAGTGSGQPSQQRH